MSKLNGVFGKFHKLGRGMGRTVESIGRVNDMVNVAQAIKNQALGMIGMKLRVPQDSEYYPLIISWLYQNSGTSFVPINNFMMDKFIIIEPGEEKAGGEVDDDDDEGIPQIVESGNLCKSGKRRSFELDMGTYYLAPEGWGRMIVTLAEEDNRAVGSQNSRGGGGVIKLTKVMLTLQFLTTDRSVVTRFRDMIAAEYVRSRVHAASVYRWKGYYWSKGKQKAAKNDRTIFLDQAKRDSLFGSLDKFLTEEAAERFEAQDFPYRKGILFYGPPGTGKTSLAAAIANRYNLDLFVVNLSVCEDDERLFSSIDELPQRGSNQFRIILLEDIDAVGRAARSREDDQEGEDSGPRGGVTRAGLLNFLGGVETPERVLFIMTTNYPERLDGATIRDGRCDLKIEIGALDAGLQARMVQEFFKEFDIMTELAKYDLSTIPPRVGARVQALIIKAYELELKTVEEVVDFILIKGVVADEENIGTKEEDNDTV